ncbi:MAG: trypsin-like peptidase domain-containing protein, partial [Acidimicrobiia bacterium]|nr:trypsin-like peptidase domain-containing protein [Acidimicrobiia bacterium]
MDSPDDRTTSETGAPARPPSAPDGAAGEDVTDSDGHEQTSPAHAPTVETARVVLDGSSWPPPAGADLVGTPGPAGTQEFPGRRSGPTAASASALDPTASEGHAPRWPAPGDAAPPSAPTGPGTATPPGWTASSPTPVSAPRPQFPAASSWPSSVRPPSGLPGFPVGPPPAPGQPATLHYGTSAPAQVDDRPGAVRPTLPSTPGPPPRQRAALGSLLLAALVGALVASLVSAAVFVWAGDDDPAPEVAATVSDDRPARLEGEALDIQELLARAQPSVVSIRTDQSLSRGVFGGAGSGVVISDDGLVLTNAHVIGGATSASVTFFDGEVRDAVLVGSFPEDDIALMQVTGDGSFVAAELGSSADIRVGDDVVAIGNALNLGGPPSVTQGIVSAKERSIQAPGNLTLANLIQTDAAINPGNSGGPLLNAYGEVVGINTAIIPDAQSIGFAIAIDAVRPLIDDLRDGRGAITLDTAFLGVTMMSVEDLLPDARREFAVTANSGAFVTDVVPDSSASDADLRLGDVIVEIDGEPVRTSSDVSDAVRARSPGDVMAVVVERGGSESQLDIVLRSRGDS